MDLMTIIWIILAVIFIFAVMRGFKKGYKDGGKKSFEDFKKKIYTKTGKWPLK